MLWISFDLYSITSEQIKVIFLDTYTITKRLDEDKTTIGDDLNILIANIIIIYCK